MGQDPNVHKIGQLPKYETTRMKIIIGVALIKDMPKWASQREENIVIADTLFAKEPNPNS